MADIIDRLITRVEFVGVAAAIGQFRQLQAAFAGFASVGYQLSNLQKFQLAGSILGGSAGFIAGLGFLQFSEAVGKTVVQFESLQNTLNVLYHSSASGKEAMDWIVQFAEKTPFTVESTVQAFSRLIALGIQPSIRNLNILGGVAKVFNRDFADVAMALGIGATGNFSRLTRGFKVTRQMVMQNAVPGAFDASGKILNFNKAVESILRTFDTKFPEAMQTFQNSSEVAISNIKDHWDALKRAIAGEGSVEGITLAAKGLNSILTFFTELANLVHIGLDLGVASLMTTIGIFLQGLKAVVDFFAKEIPALKGFKLIADFLALLSQKGANEAYKMASDTADQFNKIASGISTEPPKAPQNAPYGSSENAMSNLVKQVIGGGIIAAIGIAPSEIAGLKRAVGKPLQVEVLGSGEDNIKKGIEDIINDYESQKFRAGYGAFSSFGFG